MNKQQQYTYTAVTKPLRIEANSMEELAQKLGINIKTVNTMVLNKETSFQDFLEITRTKKVKEEKVKVDVKEIKVKRKKVLFART
jgi:hypothetical protein